tara:strand:- start:174 stop:461 length:288 start_codon:yes stop_codon:yes gene_type:complete
MAKYRSLTLREAKGLPKRLTNLQHIVIALERVGGKSVGVTKHLLPMINQQAYVHDVMGLDVTKPEVYELLLLTDIQLEYEASKGKPPRNQTKGIQ